MYRVAALLALLVARCGGDRPSTTTAAPALRGRPGTRIGMVELHRTGGVPPSWRFTVPPGDARAGERAFVDLGCTSCHRVAGLAGSASDEQHGPDLTGMGGHHPPAYFAESILAPDAVLVDGPGWIGADGRSVMPSYPDLTLRQLADLVAYLQSLRTGDASAMLAGAPASAPGEVPAPPPAPGTIFYVQVYDVLGGHLEDFERWFHDEGRAAFLAYDGVVSVDTWVDLTRNGPALATVIGFRDEAALKRFLDDPKTDPLGVRFDSFIGPHTHRVFRHLPVYRAATLSGP